MIKRQCTSCLPPLHGDGVHDDTAAIQERLDTRAPDVYLPPARHYPISNALGLTQMTRIRNWGEIEVERPER